MSALRQTLVGVFAAEEDDSPSARSRRHRVGDAAVVVTAIAFGSTGLVTASQHGLGGPLRVGDAILGVGFCLALWRRRDAPIELGLASIPIIAVSSFAGPAALIALATVAAYRRWQAALLIAGPQLLVMPIERVVHPEGGSLTSFYVHGLAVTAVAAGLGMFLRNRRQARRERERRQRAEERLRIEQARYAERTRIAREMHDVLAHRISLLSLHAGALEFRPGAPSEELARGVAVIRASAHQALEDLRAVIGMLRESAEAGVPQPPQPTLASLPVLVEESRAAGMDLTVDVRVSDLTAVPEAVGRNALRIVQEALTNARKHAPSAPVDLRVEGAPGEGLEVDVRNPASVVAGTSDIPGSGVGLVGLAERAELAGGRLEHGLERDGAFRLQAWLPWPA
jgi:signal transduction histidine kinase